jgi:hypothetical protein
MDELFSSGYLGEGYDTEISNLFDFDAESNTFKLSS